MLLLFISAKHLNDFFERFALRAITPAILILLIVYLFKFKKCQFKKFNSFAYFVLFYVAFDLLLRLYYTFILDMDNQTRYFHVQAIFYLIPAALAWEFLSASPKINKQKFLIATCTVLFLYGAVRSIRPKWDKPEYEVFAQIVKSDPAKEKYIFELKEDDQGEVTVYKDVRLSYYAGIYRKKELSFNRIVTEGSCYIVSRKLDPTFRDYQLEFIEEVINNSGDKKFLYKVSKPDLKGE